MNLEPVDDKTEMVETRVELPVGRRVSIKTLERANELGFDFVCLTGNPGTGVSNARSLIRSGLSKSISTVWSSLAKCMGPVWMSPS